MTQAPPAAASSAPSANLGRFILYVAGVLTLVMVLFPPFTSLNGTEYAFVATGPEWSRAMGGLGQELGLVARIHWIALGVQLGAVWAIAPGAWGFLGRGLPSPTGIQRRRALDLRRRTARCHSVPSRAVSLFQEIIMLPRHRLSLLAALLVLPLGTACDLLNPRAPRIESLTVSGVRIDAATFRAQGEFALGLLATDPAGRAIVDTRARADGTLTAVTPGNPANYTFSNTGIGAEPPKNGPTYAAILLDDSGSMRTNDPQRLRAAAAKVFWEAVLPARSDNHVALLDFGPGSTSPFVATRLLHEWTRNSADLEAQLPRIVASGGTPMYRSLQETSAWTVQTVPSNAHRVILLLGDGIPTDGGLRMTGLNAARDAQITVHTVGLGPASEAAGSTNANAVGAIREIAEQTGGVYSSATDASALGPIFTTLAQVTSQGQLVGAFRISPVPPSRTRVSGTVTVTSGGTTQTANWSFVAP